MILAPYWLGNGPSYQLSQAAGLDFYQGVSAPSDWLVCDKHQNWKFWRCGHFLKYLKPSALAESALAVWHPTPAKAFRLASCIMMTDVLSLHEHPFRYSLAWEQGGFLLATQLYSGHHFPAETHDAKMSEDIFQGADEIDKPSRAKTELVTKRINQRMRGLSCSGIQTKLTVCQKRKIQAIREVGYHDNKAWWGSNWQPLLSRLSDWTGHPHTAATLKSECLARKKRKLLASIQRAAKYSESSAPWSSQTIPNRVS